MSSAKKAADLIKALVGDIKLEHGKEYYSFFSGWERTVGTDIASHSRVREIERGTLIVAVDHPGWAQMIQLRKKKVLTACKKEYPELNIKDIRLVLDREKHTERPPPVQEGPREKPVLTGAADREEFDDLLKRFEEAVEKQNTGP